MITNDKIVVLIDGDNASSRRMGHILEKISTLGKILSKRVYGDFSKERLRNWKDIANKHSIKTIHGYNYSKGKNSTDINLIIDAMDILYNQEFDILCIVSSDCDFIGLIHRYQENGKKVYGFGRKDSCLDYKVSCTTFFEIESLFNHQKKVETKIESTKDDAVKSNFILNSPKLDGLKILGKIDVTKLHKS